jgi:hypothetical protein
MRTLGIMLWHVLRAFYYIYVAGMEVGIQPGYYPKSVIGPALVALFAAVTTLGLGRLRGRLRKST